MTKVNVVVCVYNRSDFIEKCLNSILSQDFDDFEIIVVDDGSKDGTAEILKRFEDNEKIQIYLNKRNMGLMRSRNIGVEKSDCEIVAFTDSDCIVREDWLKELLKPFAFDRNIMIAGGKILDGLKSGYWGMVYKGFYKIAPESGYVSSIIGCNMAMRKEFLANNKFDETLKYGADETELCIRAAKFGYKVFFNEEAKVVHYHRNTLKSAIIQSFGLGAGNCYCKFKHGIFPPITLKSVILLLFIFCVIFVRWPLNLYLSLILTTCFVPLVFLVDIAKREKNPRELILSFPARFIMIIADSAGRIYGAYKYVTSRLKKHIDKDIMLL